MNTPQQNIQEIVNQVISDSRFQETVIQIITEILEKSFSKQPKSRTSHRDWSKSSDLSLRQVYYNRIKQGKNIEPELSTELIKRFPNYDPETQRFNRSKTKTSSTNTDSVSHESDTKVTPVKQPTKNKQNTKEPELTSLQVTLKPVKITLDANYYDVYVNDKKILRNHANTELKTFANGTLLGIHGIVSDNKLLPKIPLWLLFDTNMAPINFPGHSNFLGYNVYAKTINESVETLTIRLNNKAIIQRSINYLQQIANNKTFEIIGIRSK